MKTATPRENITTSEAGSYLKCLRLGYLRYVAGIVPDKASDALRFGTAWHAAMECRWHGGDFDAALHAALTAKDGEVDALMASQISGLLAGYYAYYGDTDTTVAELYAEVPFEYPIKGSRVFNSAGKIDGLGIGHDGRYLLVEHKTAGEDIEDGADYWMRLRYNWQLMNYVLAARRSGWDIRRIVYDVTRKPTVKPRADVPVLDANGMKSVLDANNVRVFKRDGQPKQTADKDKGEVVLTAPETMEQYSERLFLDTKERPTFYFQRRDVTILDNDLAEYERERLTFTKFLLSLRALSKRCRNPLDAYPRNVCAWNCRSCEFRGPCLDGQALDKDNVPMGFRVKNDKHEELTVTE